MIKLLGREPAAWLGLVAVIVKFVSAFWAHVSPDQQAMINAFAAAIVGLLIAVSVHDGIIAGVLGFAQATLALAVGFGLHLDAAHQAVIMAVIGGIADMFIRTQVTAKITAAQVRLAA